MTNSKRIQANNVELREDMGLGYNEADIHTKQGEKDGGTQ